MKRREFGQKLVGSAVAAGMASASAPNAALALAAKAPQKNTLMHIGADYHIVAGGPRADITGKANLEYNLRHGVRHLTAQMRKVASGNHSSLDRDTHTAKRQSSRTRRSYLRCIQARK